MNIEDYDKENDILFIHWGKNKTEYSVELFEGDLVLDFGDKDKVVGLEIFNLKKQIKKHNKKMDKIFKKRVKK